MPHPDRNAGFRRIRANPCPTCHEYVGGLYVDNRGEYRNCPNEDWHKGMLRDAQAFYDALDSGLVQDEQAFVAQNTDLYDLRTDMEHSERQVYTGLGLPVPIPREVREEPVSRWAPNALQAFVQQWSRRADKTLSDDEVDFLLYGHPSREIREPWRTPLAMERLQEARQLFADQPMPEPEKPKSPPTTWERLTQEDPFE